MLPRTLVVALLFMGPALSGCLAPSALDAADEDPARLLAYAHIDVDRLTQPVFDVLPIEITRIAAVSTDSIPLYLEVHRPDTDEPVPTILHSSPYNALERIPGLYPHEAFPQQSLVEYYVPRGYAVVVADVRGFGESGGCVEVWSLNEQLDQVDLVQWITQQTWSDGGVGMIGASYPGTTPMQAAAHAAPGLKAIVAVAGLTDAYFDWHFGGVPNGESSASPAAYQAIGAVAPIGIDSAPADWLQAAVNGGCGTAELLAASYQTDGVYTDFYWERNLTARVKDVTAAVLFTQGFTDRNVKPWMILNWFNELESPKKGIFGQWAHQFPVRDDWKAIEHAWFDEHLKGIDTGIMQGPTVEVQTNLDTWRPDVSWPTLEVTPAAFHLDASWLTLDSTPVDEATTLTLRADRTGLVGQTRSMTPFLPLDPWAPIAGDHRITFDSEPLATDLYLSGLPELVFHASMQRENALFLASLYEVTANGQTRLVTSGGLNAALRDSLEQHRPVPAGEVIAYTMQFQPREYVFEAGSSLRLVITTADQRASTTPEAAVPHDITLHIGGETPARLLLPTLDGRPDSGLPWE